MDRKRRILIVISSIKKGGGAQKAAVTLAEQLSEKYHVELLTFYSYKESFECKVKHTSFNEKLTKNILINGWKLINRARKIAQFCKQNNIHQIISFIEEQNISCILAKVFYRDLQVHVCIRNNPFDTYTKDYLPVIKTLYKFSNTIIVQTEDLKKDLQEKYSLQRIQIIPNHIDTKKNQNKDSHTTIRFVTVGRLCLHKGQWALIRAFSVLCKLHKNITLTIYGWGELKEEYKQLIKQSGCEKRIQIIENKSASSELYKHDVFVFSSVYEGMPNAILEAMREGIPIVSTDCSYGPGEILGRTKTPYPMQSKYGILTQSISSHPIFVSESMKPLDESEKIFLQGMELMLDEKIRQHYSKKSLERVKNYSSQKILKKWMNILEN